MLRYPSISGAGVGRFPGKKKRGLLAAGLYWEWIVRKCRKYGSMAGAHCMEVRYEELVSNPRESLAGLSDFIQHDLDYGRIQRPSLGSDKNPLTSFKEELQRGGLRRSAAGKTNSRRLSCCDSRAS